MATTTERPTGFSVASNVQIFGGAGSAAAATNDNSDATYIGPAAAAFPAMQCQCNFNVPTLPAGAVLTKLRLRVRCLAGLFAEQYPFFTNQSLCGSALPLFYLSWYTPTTVVVAEVAASELPGSANWIFYSSCNDNVNGSYQLHEIYLDAIYVAKPTLAVTAPTGTLTTMNLPNVIWTETLDPDGGGQSSYQVKIFNAAQYGAGGFDPATSIPVVDSGTKIGSALNWQDTVVLPNATYRAYVRVAQTVNGESFWSDWDYEGFVVDVPLPGVPTFAANSDDVDGRISFEIAGTAGDASTDYIQIQRSDDEGTSWSDIRTVQGGGLVDESDDAADYETANGSTALYRARALHAEAAAFTGSGWSTTVSAAWESNQEWLKHPTRPSLNVPVLIYSLPARKSASRQGVFQPLGRADPVVVSDARSLDTGEVKFLVQSAEEREALAAILESNVALLLQTPTRENWTDTYLFLGDRDSTRGVDKSFTDITIESFPWTEVLAPVGDIDAWPSA